MHGRLSGFEWDDGNLEHCRRHGVSRQEIEALFTGPVIVLPDPGHSRTERRFRAIGRSGDGRAMFIVFTVRERGGQRYIRPVSARYMHREEIDSYAEENPNL